MKITGLQKLTLLDFPGLTACTVFTPGCNFRCPFCHNSELINGGESAYSEQEIYSYLESRRGKLDGVCITGGEPLMQNGIEQFMRGIKEMGFKVKLDTNGSFNEKLVSVIKNGLCDYVAMDIKNSEELYEKSVGKKIDMQAVKRSIAYLMQSGVDYEFRTTIVKELNTPDSMKGAAKMISGAKAYYLQQFKDSENVLIKGLTACTAEEMRELLKIVKDNGVPCAQLRGVE